MNSSSLSNRLNIVGNGFDLAHGFPTSYNDFFVNLLFYKFMKAHKHHEGYFEDEYFIILRLKANDFEPAINISIKEYLQFKCDTYYSCSDDVVSAKKSIREREYNLSGIYFHVKDEFLSELLNKVKEMNWVDIECAYYTKLLELVFGDKMLRFMKKYDVEDLNRSFEMLKSELIKYLISQQKDMNIISRAMGEIFDYPINYDFNHRNRRQEDFDRDRPKESMVLNFNYTETINYYRHQNHWGNDFQIIDIHGDLENNENPVIFGYGDEIDENYKRLEMKGNNSYLHFMKNKDYALTTNYTKLIDFIEQAPFEVYILGHSCGNSDRVMLNTIFEHKNCESIYIFYHKRDDGTDNFIEVYHNISRQFSLSKRADLRKKVKPKSISMPLIQVKKDS